MKVKNIFNGFLLAGLMFAGVFSANAQDSYVRVGGGYTFKSGSSPYNNTDPVGLLPESEASIGVTVNNQGEQSVEFLSGTLGVGFKGFIAYGYMFNEHIGVDLGINYFHGSETETAFIDAPTYKESAKSYIRGVDVIPALVLSLGKEGLNPYSRLGVIVPVAGKMTVKGYALDIENQERYDLEGEVNPTFSLGFSGVFGVSYPVSSKMKVFVETEIKALSLKSKDASVTKYDYTDMSANQTQSLMGFLPTAAKEYVFEDVAPNPEDQNFNEPLVLPTQYVNASGIGFSAGIILGL
ncbi:outer membrane beta-barrel protein [Marinigracilibium pacificum]|uniref:Outer membrane beta-barrel protein n=1 Tax=Marinigracilibium pacificum TaxID=2729599 RepID=A0A848J3I5_9BACT|nr:outer membrane beta-barrel protein [Marinigracilibium pacificum]NMM49888.1 outer membrane beta-barrel protein [Marinigracilibium pacificum]